MSKFFKDLADFHLDVMIPQQKKCDKYAMSRDFVKDVAEYYGVREKDLTVRLHGISVPGGFYDYRVLFARLRDHYIDLEKERRNGKPKA